MRFSSAVAVAAAVTPIAVSAKGKLGFSLGVRKDGEKAPCKELGDFQQDFKTLTNPPDGSVKPAIVRTYAAVDGGANEIGGPSCKVTGDLLQAAQEAGIQVLLGLWLDSNNTLDAEITETIQYASKYDKTIYGYTVGSEGLYRDQLKPGTGYNVTWLAKNIGSLKDALKTAGVSKKVGTADSWNKFQDGTADDLITGGVDLLLVNAFGYWQSQDISNASHTYFDDLQQAFGHIQDIAKSTDSIELWNGETGWPSDGGSDYTDPKYSTGTAVASTKNAQTFWNEGVCAALDWNINVFYFEAFAEGWKPSTPGLNGRVGNEQHWGAYEVGGKQVIKTTCDYQSVQQVS